MEKEISYLFMSRNYYVAEGLAGNLHFPCRLFLIKSFKISKPYGFKLIPGERYGLYICFQDSARPETICLRIANNPS
jgi:hypothetical protein